MPAIVRAFCICAARGGILHFLCPAARVAGDPPQEPFTKQSKKLWDLRSGPKNAQHLVYACQTVRFIVPDTQNSKICCLACVWTERT